MRLQLLISAVDKEPEELLRDMNVSSDAIIVNQCAKNEETVKDYAYGTVCVLCRKERGVGKSRNLALESATQELILFSDEDIRYEEGYAEKVMKAFADKPKADILLFNVKVCDERRTYYNGTSKRVHRYNCGRYPAYSIACRLSSLKKSGVKYSELFGGGAKYSNGEDSLFLKECLTSGMKVFTATELIGEEVPRESTWFKGFNEKFFFDRGVLFAFLYGSTAKLWALRFVMTKKEAVSGEIGRKQAYSLICKGIQAGKAEKEKTGGGR